MQEFSTQYIKKCKKAREEIEYFRMFEQLKAGEIVTPKPIFEEGDYFHHQDLMEEEEVKVVKEIKGNQLYTSDPGESYQADESIWIPTADQLRVGLETIHIFLGDVSSKNEEQLLDEYMKVRKKEWNFDREEWIKIEKQ